jgi:LPXTG-site transpeptidase (sortase) family protein
LLFGTSSFLVGFFPETLGILPAFLGLDASQLTRSRVIRHGVSFPSPHGTFDYRVRDILIVKPEAVWVIETTTVSMLTLISCYPFTYLGHAPERFIVRAERVPTT